MADNTATRTAREILGSSPTKSVAQEIFSELYAGLQQDTESLSAIFTPQRAAQFLADLTNIQALLSQTDSYDQTIAKLDAQIAKAEAVRDELMAQLFEQIRPLERSYREVVLFFENTKAYDGRTRKPAELYLFNADPKASKDTRSTTIEAVETFVKQRNDSFNFRKTICTLVVPGFIPNAIRDKYESVAYAYGLLMVTDTDDEKTFKTLDKQFRTGGKYEFLKRPEDKAAADVATAGYLKFRDGYWFEKKDGRVDEGDDLFGPPSMALAGAMVRTDDTQGLGTGPIGFRYGRIVGTEGCRLELLITEAETISMDQQLVPVIRDADDHLCFYGCRTLADDPYGTYKFFTSYRILRHLERMCRHYLLSVAGEPLNRDSVEARVEKPLDKLLQKAEEEGLITGYKMEIDKTFAKLQDGIVDITLEVAPTTPAETFILKIDQPKRDGGKKE